MAEAFDVQEWARLVIEGIGGMNSFEHHEFAVWNVPDRVAAACWVLRCLANPRCEGSAEVLAAIHARREEVLAANGRPS